MDLRVDIALLGDKSFVCGLKGGERHA